MTRLRLVADVGGTNTRIGLSDGGALDGASVRSFRNEEHDGFEAVLQSYLAQSEPLDIAEIVVAVAGPVAGGTARLTNRGWSFSEAGLSAALNGAKACLMNDLAALGQASPHLDAGSLAVLFEPVETHKGTAQSLIVGVGTGYNVSPVLNTAGRVSCLNAEYGHVGLPMDVATALRAQIGEKADAFETNEHVFSGRGFAALKEQFDAGNDDAPSTEFLSFYARLLAMLTRHLVLAFLPSNGIFFAGGVARGVLSSRARQDFVEVFNQPFELDSSLTAPVYAILDDAAALKGCANLALAD